MAANALLRSDSYLGARYLESSYDAGQPQSQ
jgi:hypothetical protein